MRTIERSSAFKRDYKRVKATPKHSNVDALLMAILALLVADHPLPAHNRDHDLSGNWAGYRECHIKPDLLLIYKIENNNLVLVLINIGSHSDLFE